MKKIGLIGGLSWVSTADYYRRLNEMMQARMGGVTSPRIVLESVNRQAYVDAAIERENEVEAGAIIMEAARSLERAGADFIMICCNDVHRFVPAIQLRISIPFLHIAEATAQAIKAKGLQRVALLGVRKTMEERFYPDILARHGIETIIPDEDEKAYVHRTIYDEMVKDEFRPETRQGYIDLIDALARRGAQGTILGCTEIPMLIGQDDVPTPVFSTTEIHCRAGIEMALRA